MGLSRGLSVTRDITVTHFKDVEVIAPNFKRRLSGVTSTIVQLVPAQVRLGQKIATFGPGLPAHLPAIRFRDLLGLWTAPAGKPFRIWHARRNLEMLPALVLRDVLRAKLGIVFTSAAQRKHSGWTRFLISRMDAVIATSAKASSYLMVPNTVIMHGIDTKRFCPADKQEAKRAVGMDPQVRLVGCFGRVREQKGTDIFVDAMIQLLPSRPTWKAVITGRTTAQFAAFEADLQARVKAAGLSDRILFLGEQPSVDNWYRALDLFIAPQRWEGFGLTPLEAMASGVAVVAADAGVFSELVKTGEMETGALVGPSTVEAVAGAAAAFMDDPERADAAGRNGRQRACEHFSIDGEARSVGAVYEGLWKGI